MSTKAKSPRLSGEWASRLLVVGGLVLLVCLLAITVVAGQSGVASGLALASPVQDALAAPGDLDPGGTSLPAGSTGATRPHPSDRREEPTLAAPAAVEADIFVASLVRTIDTSLFSPPSPDPTGITYLDPPSGTLLIADSEVDETALFADVNLWEITLSGTLLSTGTVQTMTLEPAGIADDPNSENITLFFADDVVDRIFVFESADGQFGNGDDTWTSFSTRRFGSYDPAGIEYAAELDTLFVTDKNDAEVFVITPGDDGVFNGVVPPADDEVTQFDTATFGMVDPESIAYNPANGLLYLAGVPTDRLAEITTEGALVRMIDISAADPFRPAGLVCAPGSLDAGVTNIYITDWGEDWGDIPGENDGKVYEMTLPPNIPDLSIVKTMEPATAKQGEPITYTLSFLNEGEGTATGVVITDYVPVSVTVQSVISSGAQVTEAIPGYVWDVEDLAPLEEGTITIMGTLSPSLACWSTIPNTASISNSLGDSKTSNDNSSVSFEVGGGVAVYASTDTGAGDPGANVQYTLRVTNTGDCSDSFALDVTGNTWTTAVEPSSVGPLDPGEGTDVTVTVSIPADALCGDDVATVTFTSEGDGVSADSAVLTTTANTVRGISLTPPSDTGAGDPGQGVLYTLRVTNTGNCPDSFGFSTAGNQWLVSAPLETPSLAPGIGTDVPVTVTVSPEALCEEEDTATLTFTSQGDGITSASSNLTTSANAVYGIAVEPGTDGKSGDPGTSVAYTLWLTNTGNCSDSFKRSITNNDWQVTAPANVGPLSAGAAVPVAVSVAVPGNALCGDSDLATVTFTSLANGAVSGSSDLTTSANTVRRLEVEPLSDSGSAAPGSDVPYTLRVTNTGNCADTFASDVTGNAWTTIADPASTGSLDPGTGIDVDVTVSIPSGAQCGSDEATVTFTSLDTTTSVSSVLTTSAEAVRGVTVTPASPAQSGDPGSELVYTLDVNNDGNCADSFDLAVGGEQWTTIASETVLPLAAGVGTSVKVTVTVPVTAPCNSEDVATVTVTSQADSSATDSSELTSSANTVRAVSVGPDPSSAWGNPGSYAIHTLQVTNEGNCSDSFDVGVSGYQWATEPQSPVGPLAAGASASVPVTVTVPTEALCEDQDTATVTVTSQSSGAATDSSELTTIANAVRGLTVLPPDGEKSGDPDSEVPYTLWVLNTGNCPDTFDLSVTGNDWPFAVPTPVGPLESDELRSMSVTATVPIDALCTEDDTATVTVTSQAAPSVSGTSVFTTSAKTVHAVSVTPNSAESSGDPGADVDYSLSLANDGNCADTFALAVDGNAWQTVASATTIPLARDASTTVDVTVTVPECTLGGASDNAEISFTSLGDALASDAATLTTTANLVAPVAMDDEYSVLEDSSLPVVAPGVLDNDTDLNCDSLTANLFALPSHGAISLQTDGSFTYTPTLNFIGLDFVTYFAYDGVLSDTATITFTVTDSSDNPIVNAGEDQTLDEGTIATFSGSFVDPARRAVAEGETIHWDFGDGSTTVGTLTPSHRYRDNGSYPVTLTVTDLEGDQGQDSLLVTVLNVPPTVNAGLDQDTSPGKLIQFAGIFTDPGLDDTYTIEWDLDDGTIIQDTLTFSHAYQDVGVYTATLTVTDDDGGVGTDTAVITVLYRMHLPTVVRGYAR